MPRRFCTRCWTEQVMEATVCSHCGAPLIGPEANGLFYVDKLLSALSHPEPEIRARVASLLGQAGEPGDQRIVHALLHALELPTQVERPMDAGLLAAAALALGQLGACAASNPLAVLAIRNDTPLVVGLCAVEALTTLAEQGCDKAERAIEQIASTAGRSAMRLEADSALARLNEPN